MQRACPQCPANAYSYCLRWHPQACRDREQRDVGEGYWKVIQFHDVRRHPRAAPNLAAPCVLLPSAQCALETLHGYHEHETGVTRAWCRGRAR